MTCAIPNCENWDLKSVEFRLFHRFPNTRIHATRREEWVEFVRSLIGEPLWTPGVRTTLCSRHFLQTDYYGVQGNALKGSAIPRVPIIDVLMEVEAVDPSPVVEAQVLPIAIPSINLSCELMELPFECNALTHKLLRIEFSAKLIIDDDIDQNFSPEDVERLQLSAKNVTFSGILSSDVEATAGFFSFAGKLNSAVTETPKALSIVAGTPVRKSAKVQKNLFGAPHISPFRVPTSVTPRTAKRLLSDHGYVRSPVSSCKRFHSQVISLKKKLHNSRVKMYQRQKSAAKLKVRLSNLLKNKMSSDKLKLLTEEYPTVLNLLISNENQAIKVKSKSGMRYPPELRKFANSLHFYSPRAYKYVRQFLSLPHPSTLISWMSSVDCGPGFMLELLDKLGNARASDTKNMMTDITVQVDEMAIRRDSVWDPRKNCFVGFVSNGNMFDTNDKTDEELDNTLATNALACLVGSISGGWKVIIGYIFTDKVDGILMHAFASKALELLTSRGFRVHAIVSDGYTANVSMFEKFGIDEGSKRKIRGEILDMKPIAYEDINPAFTKLEVPVECTPNAIYDAVHMWKLSRNFIAQCKGITLDGKRIDWKFICSLYELQESEGIRAGNKLGRYHIEHFRHKMKVRLAIQAVASASVADAISFCNNLGIDEFADSEATVHLIRNMDQAFHILNSHSPKASGFESVLRKGNFEHKKSFLEHFARMILRIKYTEIRTTRGVSKCKEILVCRSVRHRWVIGLAVTIKSVISISIRLLYRNVSPFFYVCTYRFSQDLLELMFNKIRGRLGRNTNPNVVEFENIIRRLSHENFLKSSNTGNCVQQVDEDEIPGGLFPLVRCKKSAKAVVLEDEIDDFSLHDVEYSQFKTNSMAYIAGNISMSLADKLNCLECKKVLVDSPADPLDCSVRLLINKKNRGGLVYPSQSVYKLVEMTDRVFECVIREHAELPNIKQLDTKIYNTVLKSCLSLRLFPSLGRHYLYFDDKLKEFHHCHLTRKIVYLYLKIRLFDYGKQYRKSLSVSGRHQMTKLVLFNNE